MNEINVLPIHFEDRSGVEFERLVFAFVLNQKSWQKIQWLGQTGNDGGRDIWGIVDSNSYCYQCANYRQIALKKMIADIDKLAQKKTIPNHLVIVCGGRVTANNRDQIIEYATQNGIKNAEVWSGAEFEERLRQNAPLLLKRFAEGEPFPDTPEELIRDAKINSSKNDQEIISLIIECFDRPAFTTEFRHESNIPDFEKAITDTIEVLNTGVHRLRDGTIIRKIPSRHQLNDNTLKTELSVITQLVIQLRDTFTKLKREKEVRPCGCNNEDCPTWFFSDKACEEMDMIRRDIFCQFKTIDPNFKLRLH
jgi:hypothetical protein